MSDTYTERLEAVRTAIDAVLDAVAAGEYCTSYAIGDRRWAGESPSDLLRALREEETWLMGQSASEERTSGSRAVVRFREIQ